MRMTGTENAINSLLKKLAAGIATTRKRLGESGEAFSPFRENLIYMGETGISAILTMLFSPEKSHFQGTRFLNAFMARLPCGPTNAVPEEIRISTERCTREDDSRRFVDITVEAPDIVLGIENKVWAADQPGQAADYLRWLRHISDGRKYFLVYISPFGHAPSEISLSKEAARQFAGHYACLSWNAVAEILEAAARAMPPRLRIFVDDFCRALREITGTIDLRMKEMDHSVIRMLYEDATTEELLAAEAIWHNYQKRRLKLPAKFFI